MKQDYEAKIETLEGKLNQLSKIHVESVSDLKQELAESSRVINELECENEKLTVALEEAKESLALKVQ